MLRDLRSEIVKLNFSSPLTQGSSTGASAIGNSHSHPLPLRQTNTFPQLTANSPDGLVDIAVLQATGGRSARSVSQGFTSAAHLASCQSVPQAPLTVPENSFMASLQQEASSALGVHNSASHSGFKARDVNARLEEKFADLFSQDKYCFDSEYEQCLSSRGFECKQGSAPIVYKDRLRSKVDFWVSIGSSPWVLSIIRFRYRFSFISWPPRAFFCNNKSALDHANFVDSAIFDLLLAGSVIEVFTPPTVVNPSNGVRQFCWKVPTSSPSPSRQ